MASKIVAGSSEREAQLESRIQSLLSELEVCQAQLNQIGALFSAIRNEKGRNISDLAEMGLYVVQDWANGLDCLIKQQNEFSKEAVVARAAA
ncbi:hypothetical protein [Stenotrophomonas acidaminiphila]|jgi:hypothetical protein